MKILFIGGTGVISSSCSELTVEKGHQLFLLNRGESPRKPTKGAANIKADINDHEAVRTLLKKEIFDVVVNWIAFKPEDVKRDFELFHERTGQYIFISSASVYKKPLNLPVRETDPLENFYWNYSHNKILCEQFLADAFHKDNFPATIVRPSHTYDKTRITLYGRYTAVNRIIKKKKIIIHGDGTSLWTVTHSQDFAEGFIGLLGNPKAIGEAFHITSDEFHTWDEICLLYGSALGVEPDIIHIPSEVIAKYDKVWGENLIGDKAYTAIFDNSKIKNLNPEFSAKIPLTEGIKEVIDWHMSDKSRQIINETLDHTMDELVLKHQAIFL